MRCARVARVSAAAVSPSSTSRVWSASRASAKCDEPLGGVGKERERFGIDRRRRGGFPQNALGAFLVAGERERAAEERQALASAGGSAERLLERLERARDRRAIARPLGPREIHAAERQLHVRVGRRPVRWPGRASRGRPGTVPAGLAPARCPPSDRSGRPVTTTPGAGSSRPAWRPRARYRSANSSRAATSPGR